MQKTVLKNIVILEVLRAFDSAWLGLDKALEAENASSDDCYSAHELLYKIEHEVIAKYQKEG